MTKQSDQVPVLRCVISAYVFLRRNFLFLYVLGGFYIAVNLASTWLTLFSPNTPGVEGLRMALSFALIPLVVMIFAAYLRRGLGQPAGGFMGLRFGADELRLSLTMFAVGAVSVFILFIGAMAAIFALSAVVSSVVDPAVIEAEPTSAFAHAGTTGVIAAIIAGGAVALLGIYTLARFSPAYPAAIAEERVVVFEAAAWSKGQGWRMVLAIILTSLPFYLLLMPGIIQYAQFVFAHLPGSEAEAALPADLNMRPLLWFFVLSAIVWPASNGIVSGLYVTFYRGLRASKDDA